MSLIHLVRTLCMCVKIAAMVRIFPGGLALHAEGSRCLVDTIVDGKNLDCGPAELRVNLVLTGGHGSLLLDL